MVGSARWHRSLFRFPLASTVSRSWQSPCGTHTPLQACRSLNQDGFYGIIGDVEQQERVHQSAAPHREGALRVGLNAHLLSLDSTYRSAGVSRYIYHLMRYLPQVDSSIRLVAFTSERGATFPDWEVRLSRLPTHKPIVRMLWEQLCQPFCARGLHLLHAPVYVSPLLGPCPTVVTIHDLSFIKLPQAFRASNRSYLRLFTRLSVRRAARVIVVSENTRRDAALLLGIPLERIVVIPNGVDETFCPIQDQSRIAAFRRRRSIPDRIILFVGTIEPRKNVGTLIRAYAQLKEKGTVDHKLVIGGSKGWMYEPTFALVEELGLSDEVILPGFLSPEELPLWYNAAELFAYPSLYEGFGLPPLEAMACGTPVITSNVSALPEVVGKAGIMVGPHDVEAWAEAIQQVLLDAELRESLSNAGLERAARFSWHKTAEMTVDLYRSTMNNRATSHV